MNQNQMEYLIEVKGLRKEFPLPKGYRELLLHPLRRPTVTALKGVDLKVKKGELCCLLGPNGAGKTTLLKVLATLVLPTAGEAWVNGWEVQEAPERVKEAIGLVVNPERSFYYRLTGRQNLEFFAALNSKSAGLSRPNRVAPEIDPPPLTPPSRGGEDPFSKRRLKSATPIQEKSDVERVIALTGLSGVADRRVATYSAGMLQLMSFARALLTDPEVLLVDEPTRSLDPVAAQEIRGFLRKRLVEEGHRTVVMATHNLHEAAQLADQIAIIHQGRISAQGRLEEITKGGQITLTEAYEKWIRD